MRVLARAAPAALFDPDGRALRGRLRLRPGAADAAQGPCGANLAQPCDKNRKGLA